jgi:GNAT superfamily N-acetyltransferase
MIREIEPSDFYDALNVINDAAQAYRGVIPADCWHEPYMSADELRVELGGVTMFGWFENGVLVGVMGIQPVQDITLIRHAYVAGSHQRRGIGEKLLQHLLQLVGDREILVGTWAAAWWAIRFYEKNGFCLIPVEARSKLRRYWNIPDRQAETSVVLKLKKTPTSIYKVTCFF